MTRVEALRELMLTDAEASQVLAYCLNDIPDDVWEAALFYIDRVRGVRGAS